MELTDSMWDFLKAKTKKKKKYKPKGKSNAQIV